MAEEEVIVQAEMGTSLKERYIAGMVLSGVGDALGYKNGLWEFCHSGREIHKELTELGGLEKIHVKTPKWMVSDDTVMHLATAEALMEWKNGHDKEKLYQLLAKHYKLSMRDMAGRAPGVCSSGSCSRLKPDRPKGYTIPFNPSGGGCGASMRAMCIGLHYPRPEDLGDLIAVSVESGRMTHHHPTGYLGALAAALFTAFAVQGRPLREWGKGLLDVLPQTLEYVKSRGEYVTENKNAWGYFETQWTEYLTARNVLDGVSEPVYPVNYGIEERDAFYKSLSFSGWGGSSGHDAPMIAYDALLAASNWSDLCSRSMFHSGDSDSTGVIAACCYGVMHGFHDVPEDNHRSVEYRNRLVKAAKAMYQLSHPEQADCESEPTETSQSLESTLPYSQNDMDLLSIPQMPNVPSDNDLSDAEVDTQNSNDQSLEGLSKRLKTLQEDS